MHFLNYNDYDCYLGTVVKEQFFEKRFLVNAECH